MEELSYVSQILAKSLVAFKLEAEDATYVAQSLHSAVLETPLSLEKMKNALNNSASAFGSFLTFTDKTGESLKEYKRELFDTASALTGALVKAGNKASTSGITLRNFLVKLVATTKTGKMAFNDLRLETEKGAMSFTQFANVAKKDLPSAINILLKNTDLLRNNIDTMRKVFDARQMTRIIAMLDLVGQSGSIEAYNKEITKSRDVITDYEKQLANLDNMVQIFYGNIEKAKAENLTFTKSIIADVLPAVNKLLSAFGEFNNGLGGILVQVGLSTNAILLMAGALGVLKGKMATFLKGKSLGSVLSLGLSPTGAIITGVTVALTGLYLAYKKFQRIEAKANAKARERREELAKLRKETQDNIVATESLGKTTDKILDRDMSNVIDGWKDVGGAIDEALKKSKDFQAIQNSLDMPSTPTIKPFGEIDYYENVRRDIFLNQSQLDKWTNQLDELQLKRQQIASSGGNEEQKSAMLEGYDTAIESTIKKVDDYTEKIKELEDIEKNRSKLIAQQRKERSQLWKQQTEDVTAYVEKSNTKIKSLIQTANLMGNALNKNIFETKDAGNIEEWSKSFPEIDKYVESLKKTGKIEKKMNYVNNKFFQDNITNIMARKRAMEDSKSKIEELRKTNKKYNSELKNNTKLSKEEKKNIQRIISANDKSIQALITVVSMFDKQVGRFLERNKEIATAIKKTTTTDFQAKNFDKLLANIEKVNASKLEQLNIDKKLYKSEMERHEKSKSILDEKKKSLDEFLQKYKGEKNKTGVTAIQEDGMVTFTGKDEGKLNQVKEEYEIKKDLVEEAEKEYEAYLKAKEAYDKILKNTKEYKAELADMKFESSLLGLVDEKALEKRLSGSFKDALGKIGSLRITGLDSKAQETMIRNTIANEDDKERVEQLNNLLELILQKREMLKTSGERARDLYNRQLQINKSQTEIEKIKEQISKDRLKTLSEELGLQVAKNGKNLDNLLTEKEIKQLTSEQKNKYSEILDIIREINKEKKDYGGIIGATDKLLSGESFSPSFNTGNLNKLLQGENSLENKVSGVNFLITQYDNIASAQAKQASERIDREISMLEMRKEVAQTDEERARIEEKILQQKKKQIDIQAQQQGQSSILGGVTQGAMLGAQLGGVWGAVGGGLLGGITGLFGKSQAEKEAEYRKEMLQEQYEQKVIMQKQLEIQEKNYESAKKFYQEGSKYGSRLAGEDVSFGFGKQVEEVIRGIDRSTLSRDFLLGTDASMEVEMVSQQFESRKSIEYGLKSYNDLLSSTRSKISNLTKVLDEQQQAVNKIESKDGVYSLDGKILSAKELNDMENELLKTAKNLSQQEAFEKIYEDRVDKISKHLEKLNKNREAFIKEWFGFGVEELETGEFVTTQWTTKIDIMNNMIDDSNGKISDLGKTITNTFSQGYLNNYIKEISNISAQGGALDRLEDNFKSIAEQLSTGNDSLMNNIYIKQAVENTKDLKEEQIKVNEKNNEFVNAWINAKGAISDVKDNLTEGLYPAMQNAFKAESYKDSIDSLSDYLFERLSATKIRNVMDNTFSKLGASLNNSLSMALQGNQSIQDVLSLRSQFQSFAVQAENQRRNVQNLKDVLSFDKNVEYKSADTDISYETGTTKNVTYNSYNTIEVGFTDTIGFSDEAGYAIANKIQPYLEQVQQKR